MDSFTFQEDLPVFCVTATDGKSGAEAAMSTLQSLLPFDERRQFFGIFWPGNEGGTYKAAASVSEGDGEPENVGTFAIKNGPYNSFYIKDYKAHPEAVDKAFEMLRKEHEVDPDGYCLEWFVNGEDVKCLVPLGKHYKPFTGLNAEM